MDQRAGTANFSAAFGSVVRRATSCVVVRLKKKESVYIVLSLGVRSDTQLLSIDAQNGRLQHSGTEGTDVFQSEGEALDYLSDIESFEVLERGSALLGYAALGSYALVLLATRLRSAATLPGGHQVKLVAESKWLQLPLQEYKGPSMSQAELERVENLQSYTLNNAHYFCETADVTRSFPSRNPVETPSWEFVWNRWMTAPLRALGLHSHSPHLLQGVVESRVLSDANQERFMLVLVSRRSRLHPGMRYIARGLNSLASPGNEIECEQLLMTCPSSSKELKWSGYVWRRGTVPIWWGVELKSGGVGEASINVNARAPYKGIYRYFRRLQRRYIADLNLPRQNHSPASADTGASSPSEGESAEESSPVENSRDDADDPTAAVKRRDELLLSEHFSEGVRRVRRSMPGSSLQVLNFDWHGMIKDLKEEATVEGLWSLLESFVPNMDISTGELQQRQGVKESGWKRSSDSVVTEWGEHWQARWRSQQSGIVRYNCADSLDRTNAASYFAAVQVLAEQARRIGISVENMPKPRQQQTASRAAVQQPGRGKPRDLGGALEISTIHQRVRKMMAAKGLDAGGRPGSPAPEDLLPAGWEERVDPGSGRNFYIDHNTKKTTWERPVSVRVQTEDVAHLASPVSPGTGLQGSDDVAHLRSATGRVNSAELSVEVPESSGEEPKGNKVKWGLFGLDVKEMRERLRADLVAAQAEIFLVNGDINSNLYTSTRAMHSAIIGLLQGEGSAVSKAGVGRLANLGVTLQRRWANVLSDYTRQVVIECFLGLRLNEHFPSLQLAYPGEAGVPLEGEEKDDDRNLDDSPTSTMRDKGAIQPDLVNQAHLFHVDDKAAGDSAPAGAELQPSPLDGLFTGLTGDPNGVPGKAAENAGSLKEDNDLVKSISAEHTRN